MSSNDGFRKYVEAGAALGQITRARAEELLRELMNAGEVQRDQAQHWVDELMERSRKASEDLVELVRSEIVNQLGALGIDRDDLGRQMDDILRRSAEVGRMAAAAAAAAAGAYRPRTPYREERAPVPPTTAGPDVLATSEAPPTAAASTKKTAKKKASGKKATAKKAAPGKKATTKAAPGKKATTAKKGAPATKKAMKKAAPAKKKAPAKKTAKASE